MDKFAELISDVGLLWSTYSSFYLRGIRNTLILAVVATVIGCIIGLVCGILNTIPYSKNDNLVVLNFTGTDGDFQFADETERAENVNIGVSVVKGNTELQKALDDALAEIGAEAFNTIMTQAIEVQPEI